MENAADTETSFVAIPGVRLAYDSAGQGAAVVFLNGGLLDRRQWDGQFTFFSRNYRTIRYDLRASGDSETTRSGEPFTHHEDLIRLLQAPEDRARLAGGSVELRDRTRFRDCVPGAG